jgi:hypothetical protein
VVRYVPVTKYTEETVGEDAIRNMPIGELELLLFLMEHRLNGTVYEGRVSCIAVAEP